MCIVRFDSNITVEFSIPKGASRYEVCEQKSASIWTYWSGRYWYKIPKKISADNLRRCIDDAKHSRKNIFGSATSACLQTSPRPQAV